MAREVHGPVEGHTRIWYEEEGWGVVVPDGHDLEVWVHFSMIELEGYASLRPSQRVRFSYEIPGQDGYAARACEGLQALD